MGLDVDLVKFDRAFYDSVKDENGQLDYRKGCDLYKKLAYWRKHHDIKDLLGKFCGIEHTQCDFGELHRKDLKRILRYAMRNKENTDAVWKREMKALIPVLRKVLHQTNFNTETIALSWVS